MPNIQDYDYQLNLPIGTEFVQKLNQLIKKLEKINENDLKVKIDLTGYITSLEIVRDYQKRLISGTNIKTINDQTILGPGNIKIESEVKKNEFGNLIDLNTSAKNNIVSAVNELDRLIDDLTNSKANKSEVNSTINSINLEISNLRTLINNLSNSKANQSEVNTIKSDLNTVQNKVNTIASSYIKNVSYVESTGLFTFTLQDGTTKKIDLAIEKVVANFVYDSNTNNLVLTLADGTKQTVPLTGLVDDFDGVDGQTIKVTVSSDNKISAEVKGKVIGEEHLTDALLNKINEGAGSSVIGPEKYLKDVEYNSSDGIITFTLQDDTKKQVDIPVEKTVKSFKKVQDSSILRLTLNDDTYFDVNLELNGQGAVDAYTKEESDNRYASKTIENQTSTNTTNITNLTTKVTNIESSYIKSVAYEPTAGIFTFTLQDGSVRTVDLAIEKVVTNFVYDESTKSLVLTLADGTKQSILVSRLFNDISSSLKEELKTVYLTKPTDSVTDDGQIVIVNADGSTSYSTETLYEITNRISNLEQNQGSGSGGGGSAVSASIFETIVIDEFSALEEAQGPYTHFANITLTNSLDDKASVELLNNNAVLFATYGFAIASVSSGNVVTVYSINKSAEAVTLTFEIVKAYKVWDGSYTEGESAKLINFTIDGTSYNAEEGMTWEEWCNSNYNTYGYVIDNYDGYIAAGGGHNYVAFSGSLVKSTDVIINNTNYTHHDIGTGGGN